MTAGAELLGEHADEYGQKCGLRKEMAAVTMLERALAIAWTDVLMFRGANPSPERLAEVIRLMQSRISDEVQAQSILRRGHAANFGKPT